MRAPVRLLGLLLILIGYGSLFPFDYVPHRPTLADPLHLLADWPLRLSASDVVGNVLLFVPLGCLIPALARGRVALPGLSLAAVAFGWLLQYLQFWFPSRDPSGSDAAFNSAGVLLGLLLGLVLRAALSPRAPRLDRDAPLWPVIAALLLLWLGYRWFPWALQLDFAHFRIGLRPLATSASADPTRVLHDTAAWLLWFWLARRGPLAALRTPWRMALCAMAMVAAEPLFIGNSVSLANVLGLGLAVVLRPLLERQPRAAAWLLPLLLLSIALSGLAPLTFTAHNGFLWLPFAGMLSGSMVVNTASLIEKCYLYGGATVLLASLGLRWWHSGLLLAAGLAAIEWMQMTLPGRTAEITDPVLVLLLAWCCSAAQSWTRPKTREPRVSVSLRPNFQHRIDPLR